MLPTRPLLVLSLILTAPALLMPAGAATTDVVLNLEGNPTCSSLGPNSQILEIRVTDPNPGGGTVSGPSGQLVTYDVNAANEVTWTVDTTGLPVNYTILKGKGGQAGGTVYHYGVAPGAASDNGLVLFPGTRHEGAAVNAISFCYGLATQPPGSSTLPPPVVPNLGDCAALAAQGGIDETIVQQCPTPVPGEASDERVILSFNPNNPNFGMALCTCNLNDNAAIDGVFEQCDPDAEQVAGGAPGGDPDAAPAPGDACSNGNGFVPRVPINITGVEDPDSFLCFAIGGKRSCFYHFPDK